MLKAVMLTISLVLWHSNFNVRSEFGGSDISGFISLADILPAHQAYHTENTFDPDHLTRRKSIVAGLPSVDIELTGPKQEFLRSSVEKEESVSDSELIVDQVPAGVDVDLFEASGEIEEEKEAPLSKNVTDESNIMQISKPDNTEWNTMLSVHVSEEGEVDYRNWKKNHGRLKRYLAQLTQSPPGEQWSRGETMAYWINVYNAFTVDLILENYPISSIMDLDNGKTWDVRRIRIGQHLYSLNDVEHTILRPTYRDPRIHFAVNCAARSCPKLKNSAWKAETLENDLQRAAREFINNPRYNEISKSRLVLSKIFEWYRDDFGELAKYIDRFSSIKIERDAKISFKEYDWKLNGQ